MKQKYDIVMKTPLGARYGTILLKRENNHLFGEIDLLKTSQPFDGTVDENGNCSFCGTLVSLVRTIHYKAVGKISENTIELRLSGQRNEFNISGVAVNEKEGTL